MGPHIDGTSALNDLHFECELGATSCFVQQEVLVNKGNMAFIQKLNDA